MDAATRSDGDLGARRRARPLGAVVSFSVKAERPPVTQGDASGGEVEAGRRPHSTIAALVAAETADGAAGRVEPPRPSRDL